MTMSDRVLPRKISQPGAPGGRPLIQGWIQDFLGWGGGGGGQDLRFVRSKEVMQPARAPMGRVWEG